MDFTAIATFLVVAFLAFKEWRSGSKKISNEVIGNYAALDAQQKESIKDYQAKLDIERKERHEMEVKMSEKIANLAGVVQEKDKQIKYLTDTLALRDPELKSLFTDIRNFMKNMNDINTARTVALEKEHPTA